MKTEFLKNLGLEDEVITKILAEAGKDIEREKAKTTEANEALEAAKKQNAEFKDKLSELEAVSGDAEKYKKDLEDLKADIAAKDAERERQTKEAALEAEYKERFAGVVGDNKWRDELTEKAVFEAFKSALNDTANKGKGDKDIFEALTKDKNYYENPNPLDMTGMGNVNTGNLDDAAIREIMGLPPKE